MKRLHVCGTAAALAFAACTAAAQSTTTQDVNGQAGKSRNSSRNETVVVSGCLSSGAGSTTGTAGTSGTSNSVAGSTGRFMLTNASIGDASGSGLTGTTAASSSSNGSMTGTTTTTSGSGSGSTPGTSFVLLGKEKDLQKNLNARVEVRGTIEGASSYSSGSTPSTTPSAAARTLHVNSVRKIGGSCSAP